MGMTLNVGCWMPAPWWLRHFTGLDVGCFLASRLQFHLHPQRLEPFFKIMEMLFRQDFRRGHQRHIEAAFQRHQRRTGGHGGFARPHVALQQPPHRMRAAHVRPDFAKHFRLRAGQLETELDEKWFYQAVVAAAGQCLRLRLEFFPTQPDLNLQFDEFIQCQPLPRNFHVGQFFWEMRHVNCVGARRQRSRAS